MNANWKKKQTLLRRALSAALLAVVLSLGLPAHADLASAHYHKAMALKKKGNIAGAILELKAALKEREDYAAVHYSLGILYRQKKDFVAAIRHLERGRDLEGKNAQIQYSLGLAYFQAGRKDEALSALRRAADLSPKDPQILSQVGVLLIRKDAMKAIEYLKRAVKAKPNNADYVHQLGLAYRKATTKMTAPAQESKRKRYLKEAEKHLLKAASLKESAELEFDIGVLYRRMDKKAKAIDHYERATELNPKMAAAFWDLAHLYTQVKRQDDAVLAYQKYINLGGKDRVIARKRIKELRVKK